MTEKEFDTAMAPILGTWPHRWQGPRITLVKDGVMDLPYWDFKKICEDFVRTRAESPLPEDILLAAKTWRAAQVKRDASAAVRFMNQGASESLKRHLALNYPGCKTLAEAIALERKKLKRPQGKGE